jgi:hydroxymethylpyrimidine pyrophosphatase-like HAD family hydrolase
MRKVLGKRYDEIVSDDAYLVLEHGAKIVDRKGNVVFMEEFGPDELTHVHDFIRANIETIDEIWFGVPDPSRKLQYWVESPQKIEKIQAKYPNHADVFTCSLGELKERFHAQPISNIEARGRSHVQPGNMKLHFTRSNLDMNMNTAGIFGFFMNNTNKGLAVRYAINKLNIPMKNVLVAANGINDVEMLDLDVGRRVLVGPVNERDEIKGYLSSVNELVEVESPEALGSYLLTL